jgi:hypothetical protein
MIWRSMDMRELDFRDQFNVVIAWHGYDVVLHKVEDPACGGHTVWVAQRRQVHV